MSTSVGADQLCLGGKSRCKYDFCFSIHFYHSVFFTFNLVQHFCIVAYVSGVSTCFLNCPCKIMLLHFVHVPQALSYQEKAVMSSERLLGIDHPQTIQDYVSLFVLFCQFSKRLLEDHTITLLFNILLHADILYSLCLMKTFFSFSSRLIWLCTASLEATTQHPYSCCIVLVT